MAKKLKGKFKFGLDFQELILKYTLTEEKGYRILPLYEDNYFVSTNHAVIAYAIKRYHKTTKHVPEEPFLRETLRTLYASTNKMFDNLGEDDRIEIDSIVTRLYQGKVTDPETILNNCISFSKYVTFKAELEDINIEDYDSYAQAITKFQKVNSIGLDLKEDYGTFVIEGIKDRAHRRDVLNSKHETPFWQLNRLLNGGGTDTGNVIVILSKEKFFKTGTLINIARGYLRRKKKVLFFDLENGEKAITTRAEQSIANEDQETINSGDLDDKLLKMFRKYLRLGAELVVKRMPSLSTTADDLQNFMDKLKRDKNFVANVVIVDYGLLMGCRSGKDDEFGRISDSFLDLKNLAEFNRLDSLYTAAHVTRPGDEKRTKTKYVSTDIAKCIDIPRHVDAIIGLQQDDNEAKQDVLRLEIVTQRNGMREGKMLFWVDMEKQRLKEFTKTEVKEYWEQIGDRDPSEKKPKRERKTDL